MTIDELTPGQGGRIEYVGGKGELRDRLLDMGLTPGTYVFLRKTAPLGDPIQLSLRGYELTIRKADAARIRIKMLADTSLNPFKPCYGDCQNCMDGEGGSAEPDMNKAQEGQDEAGSVEEANDV